MFAAVIASAALTAFTPVVIHDSAERYPLASASAHAPIARTSDTRPAVYGREVRSRAGGRWLQYWLYYAYQDQDRGLVRTGRHAGDWELVQYRVGADDHLIEAVYAQHSGAERCGARNVEFSGQPIVYSAHGSHASYYHAGVRDRTWPDPNDEADGQGQLTRPRLVEITRSNPRWMTYPDPWGPSRARFFIPGEQDSPKGPYFQPGRWNPDAIAAEAHPCMPTCTKVDACDTKESMLGIAAMFAFILIGLVRAAALRIKRREAEEAAAKAAREPQPPADTP
jgi:RES domain-containing protein